MNSLLSYGNDSDDDYDSQPEEKATDWRAKDKGGPSKQTDTNYEEVQMDLSEGSSDSKEREASRREPKERERRRRRRSRDRRDRRSRRSSSRERRRSRSPRRHSHDRSRKSRRYERRSDQSERNDRPDKAEDGSRFFMPGITGRFRDQIERRKQLWQKKDDKDNTNGQSKKVWETTTFAQDTDGKVANKFKRLMGIRGDTGSGGSVDGLRKQEEMFSSMEQQYEVARTATHTMRGVGLGFGSFQR